MVAHVAVAGRQPEWRGADCADFEAVRLKDQPRQKRHRPGQSRVRVGAAGEQDLDQSGHRLLHGGVERGSAARRSGSDRRRCSTRNVAIASCWLSIATSSAAASVFALNERAALVSPAIPSGAASLTSAPAAISSRAMSMLPCCAANSSGVNRFFDLAFASAPAARSSPHHVDVILDDGAHQGGLAEAALRRAVCRTARQQLRHDGGIARVRRNHQRRLANRRCDVRIGACLQQPLDHRGAAVQTRKSERGHAMIVGGVDLCAGGDQHLSDRRVVPVSRPVERGRPVAPGDRDVGARRDQRADGGEVSGLRRFDQHGGRACPERSRRAWPERRRRARPRTRPTRRRRLLPKRSRRFSPRAACTRSSRVSRTAL